MTAKERLKSIFENLLEDSLHTSEYVKKIVTAMSMVASESKKITDLVLIINERLYHHEELILMLLDQQKEKTKKEGQSLDLFSNNKQDPPKPN